MQYAIATLLIALALSVTANAATVPSLGFDGAGNARMFVTSEKAADTLCEYLQANQHIWPRFKSEAKKGRKVGAIVMSTRKRPGRILVACLRN